jgi:sarcosine oxidase subunit alpha
VKNTLRGFAGGRAPADTVRIDFEGQPVAALAGEPVAVALFAAGVRTLGRSSKYHRPRGLFCLDGHCASCYMRIDGRPNQRACMTPARDGQSCERQNAFPSADVDLLAAADWLFPEGMDHHTFMTRNRAGNALFLKMVREMGGSGTLPDPQVDADRDAQPSTEDEPLDVCVIGGGPAGLSAARQIAESAPGARVALYDEQAEPGGSLLAERGGTARARVLAESARAAGARLVSGATAIGYFPEDEAPGGGRGVLAVATARGLLRVSARRTLYATGCYDQNLAFADNDRPGVIAARACGRLAFHWGVRPVAAKQRVVILDAAPSAEPLARELAAEGVAVERVDVRRESVVGARGGQRVRGVDLAGARGKSRAVAGDLIAVAALPAPASELPRQQGASVVFDPARGGFAVEIDGHMATTAAGVFACGDVTGYAGTAAAESAGVRAGKAVAASLAVALVALAAAGVTTSGCAAPAPPPSATPGSPDAPSAPPAHVQPPAFTPAAPATPESVADARTGLRRSILDAAWRTVRDKHYDKTLGGVDWSAVRAKYEPLAIAAPSDAAFYRVLNQMIGELGQSHMLIVGPGAEDEDDAEQLAGPGEGPSNPAAGGAGGRAPPAAAGAIGDPGLTVRVIEGRPTVTRVRAGSSADRAGLAPGHVITQIAGRPLGMPSNSARPLRPVEERFAIRRAAQRRLLGPAGSRVSISYLDDRDRPGNAVLVRDPPSAAPVQLGHLPPLYPEVRAYEIGSVGVIGFNIFLVQPILEDFKRAMARFVSHRVRAVVIDLRGNPGGQGAMAIPVGSMFVTQPVTLGTLTFRDFSQTLTSRPEMGAVPFTGPLAILTDEGSASASEILAAGLQEAKRAVVVGDTTLGAVLPSVVEALPGGAVMQYVVADFKTPKGVMLEGRGVQPDRRVVETRAALRAGRDPVLDAALVALKAAGTP